MADQEINTQVEDQSQNKSAAEPSSIETRARESGWVPKDEYNGDQDNWLDAGEFVRRQPLFDKIAEQKRDLENVKKTLAEFAKHHSKVRESEYKRALTDLEARKVVAFEEGDAKKVVALDSEIRVVEKAKDQFVAEQTQSKSQEIRELHPELKAWVNKNPWYEQDDGMRAYADTIGNKMAMLGKSPPDVLKEVEKRIREEFPHKFRNVNRDKSSPVEGSSAKGGKSESSYSPSAEEDKIAEKFVKLKMFASKAEYFKELEKLNGKS